MNPVLQDGFICLRMCWQTGCPVPQSAAVSVDFQYPSELLLCHLMQLSWQLCPEY